MAEERTSEMSPVKFLCRVVAPDEKRNEVVRTFRALVGPIRGTPGCRGCTLLEDVQQPGQLQLTEEWANQHDFARHVRSNLVRRVLVAVELAAEPPDVEIETISGRRGMDLIFELRGASVEVVLPQEKES